MLAADDFPPLIAQMDADPPRWQEMIFAVVAAEQFGHPAGDVSMAGPMKGPFLDAVLVRPFVGDGVDAAGLGDGLVEAGLEGGHERHPREGREQHPHGLHVGGIVRGADPRVGIHGVEDLGIDAMNPRDPSAWTALNPMAETSAAEAITPVSGEVN